MLPRVPVLVQYRGTRGPRISTGLIRDRAERMLSALGLEEMELSVLLCDGHVMRALNRRHRGGDYATDVLAFEMSDMAPTKRGPQLLGDIVISIPTAARQAREAGKDTIEETTMLLAHGLLHLLGLDHRDATEERRMRARTDMLLAAALQRPRGIRPGRGGKLRTGSASPSGAPASRAPKRLTKIE